MLSGESEQQLRKIIEVKGLPKLTDNTITDPDQLLQEIAKIRRNGYALDNEECEVGHRCVSVPLYDYSGKIVAAISAFDDAAALSDAKIEKTILPALKKLSIDISYLLGFEPDLKTV